MNKVLIFFILIFTHLISETLSFDALLDTLTKTENNDYTLDDHFTPSENLLTNGITLQGLDKTTARVFIIDAKLGQTVEFGTLKINILQCKKSPPEERQESIAFLTIEEPSHTSEKIFSGWMFSSSPGLSALNHPVYDIWVKECKNIPSHP